MRLHRLFSFRNSRVRRFIFPSLLIRKRADNPSVCHTADSSLCTREPNRTTSPYGKGRCRVKRDGGDKKFGNRTDNSSVTLRVTAPFAQGSHKVGHAPTAITKGSHCRGRVPTVFERGSLRGKKVLKTERGGALFLFFESLFFSPKKRCFSRETLPCPLRLHFFPKDERTERLSEKGDFLRKAASPHMPPPPHDRMRHDPTREFCRMRCRAYGGTRNEARDRVSDKRSGIRSAERKGGKAGRKTGQ